MLLEHIKPAGVMIRRRFLKSYDFRFFNAVLLLTVYQMACLANSNFVQPESDNPPQGILKGRLFTETNKPASHQKIYLIERRNRFWSHDFEVTGPDGHFSFGELPARDYVLAYGTLSHQGSRVVVSRDETTSISLQLSNDGIQSLKGNISLSNEKCTNGYISFILLNPNPSRLVWPPKIVGTEISEKGQYAIDAIQTGRYLVNIQPPVSDFTPPQLSFSDSSKRENKENQNKGRQVDFVQIVDIEPGKQQLDIIVPESGLEGTISGFCVEETSPSTLVLFLSPSEVQSGWNPTVMSAITHVDDKGKFHFPHVVPGSYDLVLADTRISPPALGIHFKKNIQVTNGKNSIEWKLNETFTIIPSMTFSSEKPENPYIMLISEQHPKLRSLFDHELIYDNQGSLLYPVYLTFPSGDYKAYSMAKQFGYSCEASIVRIDSNTKITSEIGHAGKIKVVLNGNKKDIAARTVRIWQNGKQIPRLYDPLWSYVYDLVPAVVLPTCKDGMTTIDGIRPGVYELTVDDAKAKAVVAVSENVTAAAQINLDGE